MLITLLIAIERLMGMVLITQAIQMLLQGIKAALVHVRTAK
jgi:small neutral amino acid transporter SnatA (MarC family)